MEMILDRALEGHPAHPVKTTFKMLMTSPQQGMSIIKKINNSSSL